jgi:ribosomal protein S27AE
MTRFIEKKAGDIGIEPAKVVGQERHGLVFLLWAENPHVGAQCSRCHTVVWVNSRNSSVLSAEAPVSVPASGPGYRAFYESKLGSFLRSLPACPSCGSSSYNRFINNVELPRFSDGSEFIATETTQTQVCNPQEIKIWVYE